MPASPRLAVVAAACAVALVVPVGMAWASTASSPAGTSIGESTPAPTDSAGPGPSSTPSPEPTSGGTTSAPGPVESPPYAPLPSASRTVLPVPGPTSSAPPTAPDRIEVVDPNDGVAPAEGQVDEFLRLGSVVDSLERDVAQARTDLATARLGVRRAADAALRAALSLSVARSGSDTAQGDTTDVVRELYQQGDEGVANLATVMTLGPNGMLERLYNLRAMRGAATEVVRTAEQAALDLEVARIAHSTAVQKVHASIDAENAAALALRRAQRELVNAEAQLARLGLVAPQVEVGPEGCPTVDVPATLRDGAELLGARALCTVAVKEAATPQAALAVTWAFQHLGAAYACGGSGRMLPFRADCSSFVSRAYAEGAGLATAGDTWAPSTRNMVPWDGVTLDPHYAKVSPTTVRPGDLVLYDTCPQGGCPYKHVVMYLGADASGAEWMLHTNSCGDVAKVERFWGFPTEGSHTFLVARRVLALPGETLRAAATAGTPAPSGKPGTPSKPATPSRPAADGALGAIG